jgi:hypothetical protein
LQSFGANGRIKHRTRSSIPALGRQRSPNNGEVVAVDNEITEERNRLKAESLALFKAKNYAEIERRVQALRNPKEEFLDGYWKLPAFYNGIADVADSEWEQRIRDLEAWVKASPKSVTAHAALARCYYNGAHSARGSESSNKVTDAQWAAMNERADKGRKVLNDSASMRKQCPYWYAAAQRIALLQAWPREEYDRVIDEGLRVFPTYNDFHYSRLMYLLPRWFGKPGEMEAYMTKVADAKGREEGDMFYAKMVWDAQSNGGNIYRDTKISYDRARKGFNALMMKTPDSFALASAFAFTACMRDEPKLAKIFFESKLRNHADPTVWDTKEFYIKMRTMYTGKPSQ